MLVKVIPGTPSYTEAGTDRMKVATSCPQEAVHEALGSLLAMENGATIGLQFRGRGVTCVIDRSGTNAETVQQVESALGHTRFYPGFANR